MNSIILKNLFFIVFFFFGLTVTVYSQTKEFILFQTSPQSLDTSLFLTIQKNSSGISFIFPLQEGQLYYSLRNDSTVEKHQLLNSQLIYGPYKLKKAKENILFQDENNSKDYRVLYELSGKEHYTPDLFSSSTDSYNISNKLVDSNVLLSIGSTEVSCYKFFQTSYGHNPVLDKYYRVVYIDKMNLLPCRIESYSEKDLKKLVRVVFMKTY